MVLELEISIQLDKSNLPYSPNYFSILLYN